MIQVELSVEAQGDLEAIWHYIAADNVDAADHWDERLRRAFQLLSRNPRVGHRRPDLTALPVLFWPVEQYLVIYQVRPRSVAIVAISHGARDIPALLSDRLS